MTLCPCNRFVEHKDKYRLMSKLEKPRKSVKVEFNFDSPIASNLNSSVQDLLRELVSLSADHLSSCVTATDTHSVFLVAQRFYNTRTRLSSQSDTVTRW